MNQTNLLKGAAFMVLAGICFAAANAITFVITAQLGFKPQSDTFWQYAIATAFSLPFVLREGLVLDKALENAIAKRIRDNCSPRHVPAKIVAVSDIPRTRSGKITELAVRDAVHGRPIKNTEALANPQALDQFMDRDELKST